MKLDPSNIDDLKKFFKHYEGLTTNELAILADCSTRTIRNWKRKCGIPPKFKVKPPPPNPKFVPDKILPPEVWNNREWFVEAYQKYGRIKIARMIDRSIQLVNFKLAKFKIPRKGTWGSTNPCCNAEWLSYNYSTREEYLDWCLQNRVNPCKYGGLAMTVEQCAEEAGVDSHTILDWMAKFKIRTRSCGETQAGQPKVPCTIELKKVHRNRFFEAYRAGKVRITMGLRRYSNGRRVDSSTTSTQEAFKMAERTATDHSD